MRRVLLSLLIVVFTATTALAAQVVMIEKRQATRSSNPVESTQQIAMADGQVVKLVTCCGLNQDDSALFTVRDRDGYTLVDHKFTSGRFFLTPKGRLIAIQKTGPSFTVTFRDHLLNVIKTINLVNVQNLAAGDQGSVAVLAGLPEKTTLRVFDANGESQWEAQDAPRGSLFFLPDEAHLVLAASEMLYVHGPRGSDVRTIKAEGPVRFIGAQGAAKLMYVTVEEKGGTEVRAYGVDDLQQKWAHRIADVPAGHCKNLTVEFARFVETPQVIGLVLRCPGERSQFFVARFLDTSGQVVGQHKLGRRIDAAFYEIGRTFALVSDGFVYTFAKRD